MQTKTRKLQMDEDEGPMGSNDRPPDGIVSISYTRLHNTGNFENEKLEVEYKLKKGENPNEAFKKLKSWVDAKITGKEPSQGAYHDSPQQRSKRPKSNTNRHRRLEYDPEYGDIDFG